MQVSIFEKLARSFLAVGSNVETNAEGGAPGPGGRLTLRVPYRGI